MQLALRLQMAFGMRLEESLKFRVIQADKGDRLAMQSSWCKGGRAREIPITHPRQRELLDEVRKTCGDGALIPQASATSISARKLSFLLGATASETCTVTAIGTPNGATRL